MVEQGGSLGEDKGGSLGVEQGGNLREGKGESLEVEQETKNCFVGYKNA